MVSIKPNKMKTLLKITILTAALALANTIQAKSTGSVTKVTLNDQSFDEISDVITYPKEAKALNIEGQVRTSVIVDESGAVRVNKINGHPALTNSVKTQLEQLKLNTTYNNRILNLKFEIR